MQKRKDRNARQRITVEGCKYIYTSSCTPILPHFTRFVKRRIKKQEDFTKWQKLWFTASNFRMIIYGPCSSPLIHVSGHAYTVTCDVATGEYLTIDSVAKTVTKTATDGTVTNMYNYRGRKPYIFEQIPPGENSATWDGDFAVDIILLEERSEPKWT